MSLYFETISLMISGMGPMPWTINSEIYPIWARSTGNAAATFTNWVFNLAVSMSFLSLTETLTRYGKKLFQRNGDTPSQSPIWDQYTTLVLKFCALKPESFGATPAEFISTPDYLNYFSRFPNILQQKLIILDKSIKMTSDDNITISFLFRYILVVRYPGHNWSNLLCIFLA